MSKRKQETVSDIISMMRDWDCYSHLSEVAHNEIVSFANRIEEAHRRSYDKYKEHTNELNRQILELKKEKEVSDARFEICQKVNEQQEKEYLSMERENDHLRAALKPVLDCKVMSAMTAEIAPGRSKYCATIIEEAQHIYNDGRNEMNETIEEIVAKIRSVAQIHKADSPRDVMKFADRIEAAMKLEREKGAEAAQICSEIGEMIGREAACKQSVTNCNRLGNSAKMIDALEKADAALSLISKSAWFIDANFSETKKLIDAGNAIESALSAPPRNCDRPECATTKSAQKVWRKEDGGKTAYYEWLLATSTKGEAK